MVRRHPHREERPGPRARGVLRPLHFLLRSRLCLAALVTLTVITVVSLLSAADPQTANADIPIVSDIGSAIRIDEDD